MNLLDNKNNYHKSITLSASSLKTFKQCGKKFKLYKIDKIKPSHAPFHYGWVGTIVHNSVYYSIADYLNEQWHVNGPKSWTAVENFFEDIWEAKFSMQAARHLMMDKEVSEEKPNFADGSMKDSKYNKPQYTEEQKWKNLARDLVKVGYDYLINDVLVVNDDVILEHELNFIYEDRANIVGYVDILGKSSNGQVRFYDLKTSRRPPTSINNDIQLFLYRYGLKNTLNLDFYPEGNYIHLRSKKILKADSIISDDYEKNRQELLDIIQGIEDEQFEANLYQILCKFCEYRGYCYSNNGEFISGKVDEKIDLMSSIKSNEEKILNIEETNGEL